MDSKDRIKQICLEALMSETTSNFDRGNTYSYTPNAYRFQLNFETMAYTCLHVFISGNATMSCNTGFKGRIPEDIVDVLKAVSYEGNSISSILVIEKI